MIRSTIEVDRYFPRFFITFSRGNVTYFLQAYFPCARFSACRSAPGRPQADEIFVRAVTQEAEVQYIKLRGAAVIETTEMILKADEIDYDEQKHYAEARGNVKFDHYAGGEHIEADKVEYNLEAETGKYYNVHGSSPAKIETAPRHPDHEQPVLVRGEVGRAAEGSLHPA